ncbi:restriction endonuclease [Stutzerimonas nitrititolerans]|uniref:restriction endonuclease n=1 Tax=Stutzerimonas nitrititolerans TaxID=2482751 RepID=UPI0028A9461A|nr:restriction endonuclease [Stutzerimonas nitrititolerans]
MKALLNWALKNAWNLFGAIGVAGTFYFSLMYVPDYVTEITNGKINVIHESLMDDIQEIVFHERTLSLKYVETLIHGRELSQGANYPYTPDELLMQVQERFMGNKFIPLEKREYIFKTIDSVRLEYKPAQMSAKAERDWSQIIPWLFSAFGVFIASIGATSLAKKLKIDQETEMDIMGEDVVINERAGSMTMAAFEFERMVGEVLSEIAMLKSDETQSMDAGYDFLAASKDKEFIVEAKKYRNLLGLSTARDFLHKITASGKGGILVVSSGATQRAKKLFSEHNKLTDNQKAFLVFGDSKESIKKQLVNLFEV